jgi:hypothetical protein
LVTSATAAINSWTNPDSLQATTLGTDPNISTTNELATTLNVPGVDGGVPVSISEATPLVCPGAVIATNRACFGQAATVTVNNGTPFSGCSTSSCLQITGNFYGPNIPKWVNLNKVAIYHTYVKGDGATETKIVPLCTKGTDGSGDCLLELTVLKSRITWRAQGPSNGGWGSAG